MNDSIIPNITTEERKIYRASFDRYSHNDQGNVFLNFTNVRDDKGNIIKKQLYVGTPSALKLIGTLLPEQKVSFSAEVVTGEGYPDGFDFVGVCFITLAHEPE